MDFGKLGLALTLGFAFYAEAGAVEALICSGTLSTS
jgi:hypothetical protein